MAADRVPASMQSDPARRDANRHPRSMSGSRMRFAGRRVVHCRASCDQSVDDNMGHMHPAWPQLACEGLHQSADCEFCTAEGEPAAAAHARGRSREEHDPVTGLQHIGRGLLRADETAQRRHAPTLLKLLWSCRQEPWPRALLGLCTSTPIDPRCSRTRCTAALASAGRLTSATTLIARGPDAEISLARA